MKTKSWLVGLLFLLQVLGANADVVTSVTSPLGGSGVPSDTSTQTNFCGPDASTNLEIGSCSADANAGTGGSAVALGGGTTNSGNAVGTIAIGLNATNSGNAAGSICIGNSCLNPGTTTASIGIGPSVSMGSGSVNLAIGPSAAILSNGSSGIALGGSSQAGERGTALGVGATATGGAAVGAASAAGVNEFVVGSLNTANTVINNIYFGKGKTSTTAATVSDATINGTGGSGADNAAAAAYLAGGKATGSALGGRTGFFRPLRAASSSTLQNLAPAVIVCPSITLSNTSATAQTIATITTTTTSGGSVTVDYTNTASNGTVLDVDSGLVKVAWNNNAGTVAAAMTAVALQSDSDASGTLAATPTVTVATNVVSIKLTPTWVTIVPTLVTGYATFTVASSGDTVVCQ